MAQTLLFMASQSRDSFVLAEHFHPDCIWTVEKALIKTPDDFTELATVWCQTDPITVTYLCAESDVTADTRYTYNGVYKTKNMLNILNRHDLPIMISLHPSVEHPADNTLNESWSFFKLIHTPEVSFNCVSICKEGLDELSPVDITQQVVGVVLCLQVPLLALTMFQTELTHPVSLQNIFISPNINAHMLQLRSVSSYSKYPKDISYLHIYI
jgi:hypothetical protein